MIIIAVTAGLLAFFLTLKSLTPAKHAIKRHFLVAALNKGIDRGSAIRREDLDLVPPPEDINLEILFTKVEDVIGKVANRDLAEGSVIRSLDLITGQDSITGLIPQGYQAVTIPVKLPIELTNLIQIGVRADILLTYEREGKEYKSITLMKNVRVIGVSKAENSPTFYVTLAVTPEGAKTISYAGQKGVLNVAVRSLSENDKQEPEIYYTLEQLFKDKELDEYKASLTKIQMTEEVEIIRGLSRETYRFVDRKSTKESTQGM